MRYLTAAVVILCTILISVPASAATPDIKQQTRLFLDAYAHGDRDKVLPLLDPGIAIYGSDAAEVSLGTDAATTLFTNDQRLWGGPAHIGEMKNVSLIRQGNLASIFFDADFSAGGRAPIPVRFAMVWRLTSGKWLLVQSSNVVPTQGQSAADLLKKN
ncbi:MAG TPA: nuclear transport factor 2 family protein [Edaphobacter sp.]